MEKAAKKGGIQPLGDRVLVKREEATDEKTAGGIIIPDSAKKEKSKVGTIVATGPGRMTDDGKLIPIMLKPGMKVIFNSGWDNEVKLGDDREHFLVRESDILAVIK